MIGKVLLYSVVTSLGSAKITNLGQSWASVIRAGCRCLWLKRRTPMACGCFLKEQGRYEQRAPPLQFSRPKSNDLSYLLDACSVAAADAYENGKPSAQASKTICRLYREERPPEVRHLQCRVLCWTNAVAASETLCCRAQAANLQCSCYVLFQKSSTIAQAIRGYPSNLIDGVELVSFSRP